MRQHGLAAADLSGDDRTAGDPPVLDAGEYLAQLGQFCIPAHQLVRDVIEGERSVVADDLARSDAIEIIRHHFSLLCDTFAVARGP